MPKKSNSQYFKSFLVLALTVVTSTAVYFTDTMPDFLRVSLFGFPQHAPFDGTVAPVKKVPDFVHLDAAKKSQPYVNYGNSDLVDLPKYNPSELTKDTSGMSWSDNEANRLRNAKITYSVPYMGNYQFDGHEHVGSHAAVDIKMPVGTPIYAIANGTVVKTKEITSGFGYHIVVQHNNFPSLENENVKETYYSSYSHLSGILVKKGDVVVKGQQIGLSGQSGTATTPHLHFQIDNDEAPWHPFWPFTWQESNEAGLNFFEAINAGLGSEKGVATTINPMMYVQKYFDASETVVSENVAGSVTASSYAEVVAEEEPDSVPVETVVEEEDVVAVAEIEEVEEVEEVAVVEEPEPVVKADPILTVDFELLDNYYVGQSNNFAVKLRNQYGDVWAGPFDEVVISSHRGNFKSRDTIVLSKEFDSDRRFETRFSNLEEGSDKIVVEVNGEKFYSDNFKIVAVDGGVSFPDVPKGSKYHDAIVYLVNEGVVNGYPDGNFKPSKTVSRVEALKFILEGIKATLKTGNLPFSDVSDSGWYSKYLYTAYTNDVVGGYDDGTFRPNRQVNTAEFYKILFNGMGVDINQNVDASAFEDVNDGDWYAPYVVYAKELGVIDSNVKRVNASKAMTRGEVAYAIYNLMKAMK